MTNHKIGTREECLAARLELLEAEKALTRRSDELACQRKALPWVRIDKEYRFETDEATYTRERPGTSAFALEDGVVYHTYSAYARGIDLLSVDYNYLDLVPKGRDENGRGPFWVRRHDEYDT